MTAPTLTLPALRRSPQEALGVGTSVMRDGQPWTVESFGPDGTVRLARDGAVVTTAVWDVVMDLFDADPDGDALTAEEAENARLAELAAGSKGTWLDRADAGAAGLLLSLISPREKQHLDEYAQHMREVITGYRHGSQALALPDEPRVAYDGTSRRQRLIAKAVEVGCSPSKIKRHVDAYEADGTAGLVRPELLHQSSVLVACDVEFLKAVLAELDEHVAAPTVGQQVIYARARRRVEAAHGKDYARAHCPPKTRGYAVLNTLGKPRGFFGGVSAKGRRSIANSPTGTFGALRATRPGEYVLLDSTVLDVFAMDRATGMWVRLELTVAIDLYTRSVIAMRLTPYTTKARDVAGLLFDCARPKWARQRWHDRARWRYFGLPAHLVADATAMADADGQPLAGIPVIAPEAIVIDHGKPYFSELVRSVCARTGISIQPARPYTPTDKAVVERWFLTLRTGLLQNLKGYKGPDVYSRGKDAEAGAFYFVDELEEILWEWVATIHQTRRHKGLVLPEAPGDWLTPNEMYEIGVQRAGFLAIPATPDLAFEFLPIIWREIASDGLTIGNLRYNGAALDDYRDMPGPRPAEHNDRWPFWQDPDDIRQVWFRVPTGPDKGKFREVPWVLRDVVTAPFSDDVATEAKRRVVARKGRNGTQDDIAAVLAQMLEGWDAGHVNSRREHRLALRNARVAQDERDRRRVTPKAVAAVFPTDDEDATTAPARQRPALAVVPGGATTADLARGDDDEPIELEADLAADAIEDTGYDDAYPSLA